MSTNKVVEENIEEVLRRSNYRAHVFVVDKYSYPVHVQRLFCGVKYPRRDYGFSGNWGMISCLKSLRKGDLVIFYQRRIDEPPEERGFRGIFRIVSDPFFDTDDVTWNSYVVYGKCPRCGKPYSDKDFKCINCGADLGQHHILPYRVLIEPVVYFERSVDDNTAFIDRTDPGDLWTLLFRKVYGPGRERSINPVLPEEARKLVRLLFKVNNYTPLDTDIYNPIPYQPSNPKPITVNLGNGPIVKYEHILQAWFMENIDKGTDPVLNEILGPHHDIEWFGNEVMYGIGGEKVDVLVLHKGNDGIRYKATVIELKRNLVGPSDVKQVERYAYWISQLVTANAYPPVRKLTLQPVLVGHRFPGNTLYEIVNTRPRTFEINYKTHICKVNIQPIQAVKYSVVNGSLKLQNISIRY